MGLFGLHLTGKGSILDALSGGLQAGGDAINAAGNLFDLGLANATSNPTAANNARTALGGNTAAIDNLAQNGGSAGQLGTNFMEGVVNPVARPATGFVLGAGLGLSNALTGNNETSQEAFDNPLAPGSNHLLAGPSKYATNNNPNVDLGAGKTLAGNAIQTGINAAGLAVGAPEISGPAAEFASRFLGRFAEPVINKAISTGLSAGLGATGSAANQELSTGKVDLNEVRKAAIANVGMSEIPSVIKGTIKAGGKVITKANDLGEAGSIKVPGTSDVESPKLIQPTEADFKKGEAIGMSRDEMIAAVNPKPVDVPQDTTPNAINPVTGEATNLPAAAPSTDANIAEMTAAERKAAMDAGVNDMQKSIDTFPAAGKGSMEDLSPRDAGKIVRDAKNASQGELTNLQQRANIVDKALQDGVHGAEENHMFQDAVQHPENIPDYLTKVKDPEKFSNAIQEQKAFTDWVHSHQASMGRQYDHIENYYPQTPDIKTPEDQSRYDEIASTKRGDTNAPGYTKQRVFSDIRESEAAGFPQKFPDARDNLQDYVSKVGHSMGADSYINSLKEDAPGHITAVQNVKEGQLPIDNHNRAFSTSRVGGLDTTLLSPDITKAMGKYVEHQDINPVIKAAIDTPNQIAKQSTFLGGLFHNLKVSWKYGSQELTSVLGDSARAREFVPNAIKSEQAFWSPHAFSNIMKDYRDTGALDGATHDGVTLGKSGDVGKINQDVDLSPVDKTKNVIVKVKDGVENGIDKVFHDPLFQRKIPTMKMESYVAEMRRADIPFDPSMRTPEQEIAAKNLGHQINSDYGGITTGAIAKTPYGKLVNRVVSISPDFTGGKINTVGRAFTSGPAGSLARRQITGELLTAGIVSVAGNVAVNKATGNNEPAGQLATDALQGKFTLPFTNSKGERQKVDVPRSVVGDTANLVNDPLNFATSHAGAITRAVPELITGKDRYGNTLTPGNANPNVADKLKAIATQDQPLPITQIEKAASGQQNAATSALNIAGFKVGTDQTDPQVVKNKNYFDTQKTLLDNLKSGNWSQIDPSLGNVDPKTGAQYGSSYGALHPPTEKDPTTGINTPKDWNALSGEQKASYYLSNDQSTGAQKLSPLFYVDQKLAQLDPSRPHSALFDLTGTAQNPNSSDPNAQIPKAQLALDYSNLQDPSEKAVMLEREPWLKDYEKANSAEAANYQPNLTKYFQDQGWTQPAIDQYFQQHPNNVSPIARPPIDAPLQAKVDALNTITDPAERAAYFKANPDLGMVFSQLADYTNDLRNAKGELSLKDAPTASPNVQALLNSMQKGTDAASSKAASIANAKLIQNNPELQDFLANVSQHGVGTEGAKARFVGENFDQKALKDVQQMGKYDVVKNANGTYSLIAGTTADGVNLAQTHQSFTPGTDGSSAAYVNGGASTASSPNTFGSTAPYTPVTKGKIGLSNSQQKAARSYINHSNSQHILHVRTISQNRKKLARKVNTRYIRGGGVKIASAPSTGKLRIKSAMI
jgi:hypothetical protein